MSDKYQCSQCQSTNARILGQLYMSAPADLYRNFSKCPLRSKDVRIEGVSWETFSFICQDCGHSTNGLKTYIDGLKDKIQELETQLKERQK